MTSPLAAYAGRRVLVTGHTGFKGPWLCMALEELGASTWGYALAPEPGSHFDELGLRDRMEHVEGDVRDLARLESVVQGARPEIVVHMAAQALVRSSYDDPVGTFSTNVMGTVNVLEAVRRCDSVRALVVVTSDKCYLNREWQWGYRENDELGGRDPYSASKAAAELAFAAYAPSFFATRAGFGAAAARAGNVIGGGDTGKDRIVPDCVRALGAGEPMRLRSPGATRPWQHVLDCLSGYLLLGARLLEDPRRHAGAWNFGPDARDIRTVEELTQRLIAAWGSGTYVAEPPDPARHEAHALHLSSEKAQRHLGWAPRWSFERAVTETVAWYRRTAAGEPALDVTRSQIRAHLAAGPARVTVP